MPITLTETVDRESIEVPAGGEGVSRAALVAAFQTIANRLAFLETRLGWPALERVAWIPASAFAPAGTASLAYSGSGTFGIQGPHLLLPAGTIADFPLSALYPANARIAEVRVIGSLDDAGDELKVQRVVYPLDPASGDAPGYVKDLITTPAAIGGFDETFTHVGAWDTIPWYNADLVFSAARGATVLRLAADAGNANPVAVFGVELTLQLAP